jgi:ABC-type bacteriocin/lantibiotic exporter with double-glycine peptidase domain
MRQALHVAAADFVFDLPAGLDTLCSEVGAGLSEGQAQRVAIARALLRPGGILILDEASSSLDSATEQILLDRLASACKGQKTILFISHREAVSRYADATLAF